MSPKNRTATFAQTLAELEVLISSLEDNETPLEKSLKDFEHGVQLIRQLQKALLEAEQNVKMLLERDGEPVAVSMQETDAPDADEEGL